MNDFIMSSANEIKDRSSLTKMDSQKPKSARSALVSHRQIVLTKNDPLERLKEFCNQGKYHYKINWDKFSNGFMCECTVYYYLKKKSTRILKREAYWVETGDLKEAKETISAIFLESIGLGVPAENNDVDGMSEELLRVGTKAITGLMSHMQEQSWGDMADD